MESDGSVGHPDKCVPCAFYCYSLRGCNKGAQCNFCHMTHAKKKGRRKRNKNGKCQVEDAEDSPTSSPPHLRDGPHAPPGVFLPYSQRIDAVGTADCAHQPPGLPLQLRLFDTTGDFGASTFAPDLQPRKIPFPFGMHDNQLPHAYFEGAMNHQPAHYTWDHARMRLTDLIIQELTGKCDESRDGGLSASSGQVLGV